MPWFTLDVSPQGPCELNLHPQLVLLWRGCETFGMEGTVCHMGLPGCISCFSCSLWKDPDKKQLQRGRTLLRTHSEATGQRGGEGMVAERLLRPLGSEAAGLPLCPQTRSRVRWSWGSFGSSSSFSALLCQGAAHSQCGSSLLS